MIRSWSLYDIFLMISKGQMLLFGLMMIHFSLWGQELDGKIVVIQASGTKAKETVLYVENDPPIKNGSKVQLGAKGNTPNQSWRFEATGDGKNHYYIINQGDLVGKHKYLEAAWTFLGQDGGKVQLWEFTGGSKSRLGSNQVWKVEKNKKGTYSIISAHLRSSGRALTIDSFSPLKNGTKVYLYANSNQPNQLWNLLIQE